MSWFPSQGQVRYGSRKTRGGFFERDCGEKTSVVGFLNGIVGEKTSGLELGAQTLLVGVYSLTNGVPGPEL